MGENEELMTRALHHKPKVSVVMATFNAQTYLKEAIESILNQTFRDFEFIIIDDGSTDTTIAIIQSYKDPRIKLYKRNHRGLIASLNEGIELSKGEYIARMDADDVSDSKRFELQVKFLDTHPDYALLGTTTQIIDTQGRTIAISAEPTKYSDILKGLLVRNVLAHGSTMTRKTVLEEQDGYDPKAIHAEDYDLWTRIVRRHKVSILPQVLFKWRLNPAGVSVTKSKVQRQTVERIRAREWKIYTKDRSFPKVDLREVWRARTREDPQDLLWRQRRGALSVVYSHLGRAFILHGKRIEAFSYALASVILDPKTVRNYFYLPMVFLPKSFLVPAENFFRPIKDYFASFWWKLRRLSMIGIPEGGVLFIRRGIYPGFDFPEVHQFAEEMVRNGKSVGVVCLKSSPAESSYEEINGVKVFRLAPNTRFYRWFFQFFLLLNLVGRRYDVIHVFWGKGLAFLPFFAHRSARKWLLDVRSGHIGGPFSTILNNGLIVADSYLFDWVITLDERLFQKLWRGSQKIRQKVRFVPMGVNGEIFRPSLDRSLARKAGIREGDFTLVYQGTLEKSRHLDHFLQGFALARRESPNLRLLVVGGGPNLPNLEKTAKDLGVGKNVTFVGRVPYTDVPKYISVGDAGVSYVPQLPMFFDQQVTKTLEYLACGRPVLGTKIPFNEDVVTSSLGVLTDDDPQSVAAGIGELVRRVKEGKIEVRHDIVEHLTWSSIVSEKLLPIYNS